MQLVSIRYWIACPFEMKMLLRTRDIFSVLDFTASRDNVSSGILSRNVDETVSRLLITCCNYRWNESQLVKIIGIKLAGELSKHLKLYLFLVVN